MGDGLMESPGGQALRNRLAEAKDRAIEALEEGASSHAAFAEFLKDIDSMAHPRP